MGEHLVENAQKTTLMDISMRVWKEVINSSPNEIHLDVHNKSDCLSSTKVDPAVAGDSLTASRPADLEWVTTGSNLLSRRIPLIIDVHPNPWLCDPDSDRTNSGTLCETG